MVSAPTKIPAVWANAATSPYIRPVPTPSQIGIQNGAASFTDGYPPNCFVPLAAGGAGPFGSDINGILSQVTAGLQWAQAGGPWNYDATFQTAIGGYPINAIVASASTNGKFYISTVAANVTDPDTGGAGWLSFALPFIPFSSGIQSFTTVGTFTFTVPANINFLQVEVIGNGGGGGGGNTGGYGCGGGAGGYALGVYTIAAGTAVTVTIGLQGTGVNNASGNAGGINSFGSHISATGGGGGGGPGATAGGGSGDGVGGTLVNAFGGGGSAPVTIAGQGGGSFYGSGGTPGGFGGNGGTGSPAGAGGGGAGQTASGSTTGGNGALGWVIVRW